MPKLSDLENQKCCCCGGDLIKPSHPVTFAVQWSPLTLNNVVVGEVEGLRGMFGWDLEHAEKIHPEPWTAAHFVFGRDPKQWKRGFACGECFAIFNTEAAEDHPQYRAERIGNIEHA